jgi:hypothetical protein
MARRSLLPDSQEVRLKKNLQIGAWLGVLSMLLSACGAGGPGASQPTTPAPEAIFTSAAQTAEARRIERFAQTATLPAESLIETSAFETPTPSLAPSEPSALQTSPTAATAAATQPAQAGDRGEFVADVNIPDGTVFSPNEGFQKTWRIANAGQTTWTPDYALVYIDGALMGAEAAVPISATVAPGERFEITVNMVAPPDPGGYRGYWKMRNNLGQVFGFGANADEAIWVDIVVESGAADSPETAVPSAGGAITSVSLSVDNPEVVGACPHTFIFTARINLSKPATVSYTLEVGSTSGTEIRQPFPATQNLGAGTYPVVYELSVPADTAAWARLHLTQPAEAFSNQVDFSLTCG